MTRTKAELSRQVSKYWKWWRLVFSDGHFDYNTVFHQMSEDEVDLANAALDKYQKQLKAQSHKK